MDELVNSNMKQGKDPDSYLMEKTFGCSALEKMGEPITDRRSKDICAPGFTAEYKDIKIMVYRDPTFDINQMQSTMRHLYLDDLSRNSDITIAGRGVAMTTASTCSHCGEQGRYARNCWKRKDDNDSKSTGAYNKQKNKESSNGKAASNVGAEHKWCSVHKTTSHDNTECYKQRAPCPPQSGRAYTVSAAQGASTRPNEDEKPSLDLGDSFEERLTFTGLLAGSGNRGFHLGGFHPNSSGKRVFDPNSDKFTMLVDSGASDHLIDVKLISRLRKSMRDFKKLKDPKTIMTNGKKVCNSNGHHLRLNHRLGWQACSCLHLGHVRSWTGTQCLLLHQSNAIRGKHYPRDRKPPIAVRQQHFASAHPTPRDQGRMLLRRISSHPGRHA